ncbi:MAG: LPS export ABC transporter permease LptG [Syntrophotaleaceae bacterium]
MTILTRYLTASFGRVFILALAAFTGLYLLVDFFERVDNFIEHSAAFSLYLVYFLNKIPFIATQVAPLACLLAVFTTLGNLSRYNELTALHSAGISLLRITAPLLTACLLLSMASLATGEYLVPSTIRKANFILESAVEGKPVVIYRRHNLWLRDGKNIVNIRFASPETATLQGVSVLRFDERFTLRERIDAAQATHSDKGWLATEVVRRRFEESTGAIIAVEQAEQDTLPISITPADFRVPGSKRNEDLNYRALKQLAHKLRQDGFDPTRFLVDMHARIAYPFSCLIMGFLGIPFALSKGRKSSPALGIGISVAIGILFFILQAILLAFGYSQILPPLVAAWSANLLFLLLGGWLFLSREN